MSVETSVKEILVIDDSPGLRKMIISCLSNHFNDFKYIEAEDGMDGLHKIKIHDIKMIIVDYHMPRMNGLEFIQKIKNMDFYSKIPIIVLTSEMDERRKAETYHAGAVVYVYKPFKWETLIKTVKTVRYWQMK